MDVTPAQSTKRLRAVGVIPARYGSTRLPGKSLISICGKPLVVRVVERARLCAALDRVIVATDDARIVEAVEAAGGEAVMTRADHPSGTDRVAEVIAPLEADIVVNVQGDEPLIDPNLIGKLVEALAGDAGWDMATAATPIVDDAMRASPAVVKVVWDATGRALYFSRSLIPYIRDPGKGDAAGLHWRHLGIYAYRRAFLAKLVRTPPCATELAESLEQLRALHIGGRMLVLQTQERGIGVDTPADVAYVERIIREQGLG